VKCASALSVSLELLKCLLSDGPASGPSPLECCCRSFPRWGRIESPAASSVFFAFGVHSGSGSAQALHAFSHPSPHYTLGRPPLSPYVVPLSSYDARNLWEFALPSQRLTRLRRVNKQFCRPFWWRHSDCFPLPYEILANPPESLAFPRDAQRVLIRLAYAIPVCLIEQVPQTSLTKLI